MQKKNINKNPKLKKITHKTEKKNTQKKVYNGHSKSNLYDEEIEVDYKGEDVSVHNLLRTLSGRHEKAVPLSKRLRTDSASNVLIYLTGHGGEDFLKFSDRDDLQSHDLADAIKQMEIQQRYHELLLVVDTCEAFSLFSAIYSKNVLAIASSDYGEKSLSVISIFFIF